MSTTDSFHHIKVFIESLRPNEVAGSSKNNNLEVLVKFSRQDTSRLILSYDDYDEEIIDVPDDLPPLVSPLMVHDPHSTSSLEMLSLVLHNLSIEESVRYQILSQLSEYVDNVVAIIKAHNAVPKNVAHQLCFLVVINLVHVHRERVSGPRVGSTPADDGAIGCLKRVRVEEYVKDHIKEDDEKCLVCLEEFLSEEIDEEGFITCLPCDHAFHDGCIVKWLKTSHFCPLCRFELPVAGSS